MPIQPENKIFPQVQVVPPKSEEDVFRWAQELSTAFQDLSKEIFEKYNLHLDQTHAHPKSWAKTRVDRPSFRSNPSDTSQVVVPASATQPAYFVIGPDLMEATSDLTMDLDVAGPGGLRVGLSKAANTMYYLYAVKSSGAAALLADTNAPTTGPSGYSDWSYIGAFSTIAASAVAQFHSSGGVMICEALLATAVSNTSPATAKTMQVPTTAKMIYLRLVWTAAASATDDISIGATAASANNRQNAGSTTLSQSIIGWTWVPILTSQTVFANVTNAGTDAVDMYPFGWVEVPTEFK